MRGKVDFMRVRANLGADGKSAFNTIGVKPAYDAFSNIGFRPKKIVIADIAYNNNAVKRVDFYDADYGNGNKIRSYYNDLAISETEISQSTLITNVSDTGFTMNSTFVANYMSAKAVILASG